MNRGGIYWCDLEPRTGHEQGLVRPVVVVSAAQYNNSRSPMIGIIPLTTSEPKHGFHVVLEPSETGLDLKSTALVDQARFIDRQRLRVDKIGQVTVSGLARLDRQLARAFGL